MSTQTESHSQRYYLKDYKDPEFQILSVRLKFNIQKEQTFVLNQMRIQKVSPQTKSLFLDGQDLQLLKIECNGKALSNSEYTLSDHGLTLHSAPDGIFELTIENSIRPETNTALEGLYRSGPLYCTQCEAQGFRRITYYMDRPDVMSQFHVTIEADKKEFPILLSNGNRISTTDLSQGRHQAIWEDPFKKPAYLFALVAGDLGVIRDQFQTMSGRKINLEVYAPHGKQNRCWHAMESLKKSMKWDEEHFGLEYDLNDYMIVSTDDFNMGAMENKGLNIFNSRLVLADSQSATDDDFFHIESVVAHEYFHNWTGNRVTLKNWFHLSLKEGLTVFRDQEFSSDMSSRAMIRIDNVNGLRMTQFAEDAGPNAHPIRPDSCISVDNFYTATIYEKGAEVIRMLQTMTGRPGFRKGMDLYFQLYDGKAVTIDEFAQAIAEPNQLDLSQFKLWYSQAGTPRVQVLESYDQANKTYTLTLKQSCPATQNQPVKKPFHIPLVFALLDSKGQEMTISCSKAVKNTEGKYLLHLKEEQEVFTFNHVQEAPFLSMNREFSAPIILQSESSFEKLLFLMKHDQDSFNAWESAQQIYIQTLNQLMLSVMDKKESAESILQPVLNAMESFFQAKWDPDYLAKMLTLPDKEYFVQQLSKMNVQAIHQAYLLFESHIGSRFEKNLSDIYYKYHGQNIESKDPKIFGQRRLKNKALQLLVQSGQTQYAQIALRQYQESNLMTDKIASLSILVDGDPSISEPCLQQFYHDWKNDAVVLNKWFAIQALAQTPNTFENVKKLWNHPSFQLKNPNNIYSLMGRFSKNMTCFFGSGPEVYHWAKDRILQLDPLNPQVAARMAGCFNLWKKLPEKEQLIIQGLLKEMLEKDLSPNTREILFRCSQAVDTSI